MTGRRYRRRLLFAALFLAAMDPLVPSCLRLAEAHRYESDDVFRFENSDLFALGPLVGYLREHPHGRRPRVAFLGNSVVWGYGLPPEASVAAEFQKRVPAAHVFNLGVNGLETGGAYLISKALLDAISTIYVFDLGAKAPRLLPQLIPVEEGDIGRFGLAAAEHPPAETVLGLWHLHRYSYRLQAAMLGTSTRVFIYTRLAAISRLLARQAEETGDREPGAAPVIDVDARAATTMPSRERLADLSTRHRLLWEFAELVHGRRRSAIFVEISSYSDALRDDERADLNAHFNPDVRFLKVNVPDALRFDGVHLTRAGTRALAEVLWRLRPSTSDGA